MSARARPDRDDARHAVGGIECHIECRFSNGEKFAPIKVDGEHEELANWIAAGLNALAVLRAKGGAS